LGLFCRAAGDETLHLVLKVRVVFGKNFETLFGSNLVRVLSGYWAQDNFLLLLLVLLDLLQV
jgi:hypothetical protein